MKITNLQQIIDNDIKEVWVANRPFTHEVHLGFTGSVVTVGREVYYHIIVGKTIESYDFADYIRSHCVYDKGTKEEFIDTEETLLLYDAEHRQMFSTEEEAIAFHNLPTIDIR